MLENAIGIDDIRAAAARLQGRIHRTPVITGRSFDERGGHTVFFECENLPRAGAFRQLTPPGAAAPTGGDTPV